MILYGIPTCDTCKKAQKALVAAGRSVTFRDVRKDPLSEAERAEFLAEFGDRIVNRASTTYRGLSEEMRASGAEAQLAAHPTVMKRPVIRTDDALYLGWKADVQDALLK